MKWLLIIIGFLIISGIVIGAVFYLPNISKNSCELDDVQLTQIPVSLAQSVASEQVHRNNPPFNWTSIGYIQAEDIIGEQYYYVFIFVKEGFNLNTLDKFEKNALSAQSDDEKYQFNDVATVIVGAVKEDKQIFRHFRGIPEFFVEKSNIKNYVEGNYNGKTIGNLVLASQGTTAYYEILSNSKPSGDLIRVPDKEITSTKSLVDLKENNEKRRLSGYSKDECESYKKAIEEARQSHITEWDSFN
ncbi:hypothetical protein J4205_01685 [Candidatus Pacearchaeota archaeon]|nr:hypothetical protein [Candidatus Pacearchaeota archaeon]